MTHPRHNLPPTVNNNMYSSMVGGEGMYMKEDREGKRGVEEAGILTEGNQHIRHKNW